VEDPDDIRRQLSGKPARGDQPPAKRQRERKQKFRDEPRTRQPRASERSSIVAQDWYDRGTAQGFPFPYDVNYLALAIQQRVERDPEMQALLAKDEHDKVQRWLAKMVANWWDHYVDGTITASNAKEYFLGQDWDDLRDWALSNLRKDYLLRHGKRVRPTIDAGSKEYAERLEGIRKRHAVERFLDTHPEDEERPELDPEARDRLRSFANRRRKK
jgi:hypothetical protein